MHALVERKESLTHLDVLNLEVNRNVALTQNALVNSHVKMVNVITHAQHCLAVNMLLAYLKTMRHGVDVTVDTKKTLKANVLHNASA